MAVKHESLDGRALQFLLQEWSRNKDTCSLSHPLSTPDPHLSCPFLVTPVEFWRLFLTHVAQAKPISKGHPLVTDLGMGTWPRLLPPKRLGLLLRRPNWDAVLDLKTEVRNSEEVEGAVVGPGGRDCPERNCHLGPKDKGAVGSCRRLPWQSEGFPGVRQWVCPTVLVMVRALVPPNTSASASKAV